MPTVELMGLIESGDRAVVSLAHFSHVMYLRSWPWRGNAVPPPHPLLFPHCHSFFGVITFTRSLSPSLLFTLFISQQLHYLVTPPRPVRDECPTSCCCCCRCLAAVVSRDIFLDETEHHVSVRPVCWLSASHAMCLPGTGAACRQTKRWDTLLSKSKRNTHFVMKTNGLLVFCDTCRRSMHNDIVQRARSNSPRKLAQQWFAITHPDLELYFRWNMVNNSENLSLMLTAPPCLGQN